MHVALTVSSLVYVLTSLGKTLYMMSLAREKEERELVCEAVQHVWVTFVKQHKRDGTWTIAEHRQAKEMAIDYVRRNERRPLCGCMSSSRRRIYSWITDNVESRKRRDRRISMNSIALPEF